MILLLFLFMAMVCAQKASVVTTDVFQDYEPQLKVGCYFSAEFQGEFVMQVSGKSPRGSMSRGGPIQYSTVNITFNSIPVWGYCHQRVGDRVLLIDSGDSAKYKVSCKNGASD